MSYSNTDVKMSRMIYSTDFMTGSWYPQLNRKSTKSNTLGIRDNFASFKHTLPSRTSKLNTLYQLLKDHADATQHNVRSFLEGHNPEKSLQVFQSWMTNELIVKDIDMGTILALEGMDDIKEIRADRLHYRCNPSGSSFQPEDRMVDSNQWGVKAIHAPEVWAAGYRGAGVVVGTIDTGVRGTHEALRDNHRKENGWLDPVAGDISPTDNHGHGTHTMGTIVGQTNGIGVAPQAQWIACKGCNQKCWDSHLIICANFMGCPTDATGGNAKCELAPNLVSNSWGGGQDDHRFDEVISAWILVDIVPFFSAGNYGTQGCVTITSPGDHIDVITVGATNSSNMVSDFSSLGPTHPDGRMKPEVSAPGSYIISSYHSDDKAYTTMSGTSMACPHAAGVAALLFSKKPGLTYNQIKAALVSGAQPTLPRGETCGDIPDHIYANNHAGAGQVDAIVSVNSIESN